MTLLHVAEPKALEVYNTFQWDSDSDENKVDKIMEKFEWYCNPRKKLKLELTGNLVTNWKKFHCDWNYKIAARLKDPENPAVNKSLRTATLLTCIGSDALDVYEGLEFENEDDKKDIDIVLQRLQRYCIGETNEIYQI